MGFILVMLGFLVQWPTLLKLAMFPVLVWMYVRLAHQKERDVRAEFGKDYDRYATTTPAWFPVALILRARRERSRLSRRTTTIRGG